MQPVGFLAIPVLYVIQACLEELGWRGYMLDRVQIVWKPLEAALIIGVGIPPFKRLNPAFSLRNQAEIDAQPTAVFREYAGKLALHLADFMQRHVDGFPAYLAINALEKALLLDAKLFENWKDNTV